MTDELKIDEDIARGLPGGVIDYATHEAIEEALDRANAPITEGGRFLTLVERISAFASQRNDLLETLKWYGENARLCRLIHREGDAGRNALSEDGGKRAQASIAKASA